MKKFTGTPEEMIAANRHLLGNPYAYLNDAGGFDAIIPKQTLPRPELTKPASVMSSNRMTLSRAEQEARNLQLKIWNKRHELWPEGVPADPIDLLDPVVAIKCIGYEFDLSEYLGEFQDQASQIAGIIDRQSKRISISRRLPHDTLRFTTAHELGHALLHKQAMMHRDRPLDGSRQNQNQREPMEKEADKFAACFLMPEKLVKQRFEDIFGTDRFILNEDTAFALEPSNPQELIIQCKTSHDIAMKLAKADHYNGRHIRSLAAQFGVSITAMAIRIEELRLISA